MKDYDRIIDNKFGIIQGKRNLVFVKTDKGEDIYGQDNRYLEICSFLSEENGCTYVVSSNLGECYLEMEIERINEEIGDYDQIYYIGIGNGGLIGVLQCWMIKDIKDAYLLNVSLETNFKYTLNIIEKFKGNLMKFVYGDDDPLSAFVTDLKEIHNENFKCDKWVGKGHVFDKETLEFDLQRFLNEQMYTRDKFNVTEGNKNAFEETLNAYEKGIARFIPRRGNILYLYGDSGCGKTHLLNMVINSERGECIRVQLDDAEDVYDYDDFLSGYSCNDIAMIDNVDRLDSDGVMILNEAVKYTRMDKEEECDGMLLILSSKKSPEETFADKELVSWIRRGVVVEMR